MNPPARTIMVVDDDKALRSRLARALEDRGWRAVTARDASSARVVASEMRPSHVVLDLSMPGDSGLVLLRDLRASDPDIQIVILTGYGSIATAVDAMRLGATNMIQKPADADMVLAAFERRHAGPHEETPADYEPPSLARAEWEHIQRVLTDCGGNVSQAARKLGMHRRTLQRKLKTFPPRQ
ncbi:MAG: response regulator [Myxococcota bacterium]|nr:response regulator [Myxococcota bacterium]MEC8422258.1 response regulator [Myxococcota bacterium]